MNDTRRPARFDSAEACIDWLIERVGRTLRVGAPLGLGKPPTLLNALYARAKSDPTIDLTIITALSLDVPEAESDLEARLMNPIVERVFEDYPGLDYLRDIKKGKLAGNVTVSEFFFQPGEMLGNDYAQQHYRSVNYTHAARDLMDAGVNVLMQMVAPGTREDELSLSCNTDVTLDLIPVIQAMREQGNAPLIVGQVNRHLPVMTRSALVPAADADALFEGEAANFKPFGAPAEPVSKADYAIAARVSALIADGGTLQIGIGSLSDAIAWCCGLRQKDNAAFRGLVEALAPRAAESALIERYNGLAPFETGLYGCTEMLVDAYMHLYRDGVIGRAVYDDAVVQELVDAGTIGAEVTGDTLSALIEAGTMRTPFQAEDVAYLKRIGVFHADVAYTDGAIDPGDGGDAIAADPAQTQTFEAMTRRCLGTRLAGATLVHGGFFLGPNAFYQRLRDLTDDERELFHMTSVGEINQLYGNEPTKRAQRRRARFVNTAIKASLDGAVSADGLENGRVLSGVGGQYNFVAQAHELEGARSIICLRSTRAGSDGPESNIVARYGYNTIPRHLRDIVVTEYGVADLRGATDAEIAARLIEIADARFQDELRSAAVSAGKLPAAYKVPAAAKDNTPARIARVFQGERAAMFPRYPYGSDFTEVEDALIVSLKQLAGGSKLDALAALARHGIVARTGDANVQPYLARMGLADPEGWRERLYARVVVAALHQAGYIEGSE